MTDLIHARPVKEERLTAVLGSSTTSSVSVVVRNMAATASEVLYGLRNQFAAPSRVQDVADGCVHGE
ncbi:uncharacterized protein N7477_007670 [Penicillium maclennaniae]|uniref:uncharacterized protein n=1 Tax=Penicillium maclennaniae TaxID=1343394 RepID=UPI0025425DC1|nr:uncharacterized protein N7477_007670 [Penicillium maclennaniae]KAJ5665222.1 hypothetical protein N7477_007670 [Penicillium maclennaniae]